MSIQIGSVSQPTPSQRSAPLPARNGDSTGERVQPGSTDPSVPLGERRLAGWSWKWIGRSVRFEGKLISTDDLTIDGYVEGSIELGDHSLTIGSSATIKADLVAKNITISGAVTGNVRARERLDVRATASVVGDIAAPRLVIAEGAVITGQITVGDRRRTSAAE